MKRYRFRIILRGARAVVQSYADANDPEVLAGSSVGWGSLISGFSSVDEARAEFSRMYASQDIEWTAPTEGTFAAFQ